MLDNLAKELAAWFANHPLWHDAFTMFGGGLILFFTAKARTIYSNRSKQSQIAELENRIAHAEHLIGDTYKLELFVFDTAFKLSRFLLFMLGLYAIVASVVAASTKYRSAPYMVLGGAIGFAIGFLTRPAAVLALLRDQDAYTQAKVRLASLKKPSERFVAKHH